MEAVRSQISTMKVGLGPTMSCSPSAGIFLSTDKATGGNVCQCSHLTITQCNINMLSSSTSCPGNNRRHDTVARVQSCRKIRNGNSYLDRWPISTSSDMHQPKFSLNHDIISSSVRVWSSLAIASNRSIYQAWVDLRERPVVHPILLQTAR